ncbi:Protein kinase-like (PK-like) [Glarea lozoyensis ATCC 20868]|uniref:Protein kinase-like (PK-like) n=1 Tax=Glarea lozoyensis (strain ATCC 20868 / MF5171) TaxID=1116229 RepID=S3E8H3_GLAL2|nr:Protein kinase-like (PK-like) [Glarea lozoyensis ATCC 20868]EPE34618.1 Protein kinase-like (PK-like) [Glarea lozoyensis ATCC 20868]
MEKNEKIEKADEIEKVDEIEKAKKDEDEEAQRIKNEEYLNRLEKNNVELRAQRLAKNPEYYTRMAENIEDFVMKTEDFAHPEKVYPGLIYAKNRYPPEWAIESRKNLDDVKGYLLNAYDQVVHHELCWFCGLTAYEQAFTSYAPRLKILHTNSNTGLWALGSKWLIKDAPNDGYSAGNDYMTQKFLRDQLGPGSDIPLLRHIQLIHEPEEKTYLYLMSRAEGAPLHKLWPTLSQKMQSSVTEQLLQFIQKIRTFTAPAPYNVEGGKLHDWILGNCNVPRPKCKMIGSSTDEWFGNIEEELREGLAFVHMTRDSAIIDREFQALKDNFPKPEPYVLTHGDLDTSNIIVKDGKITALIDWEHAGYFPWWAERYFVIYAGRFSPYREAVMPIFDRLEPTMSADKFEELVVNPIKKVQDAWSACQIKHPTNNDAWLRPAFSKCQPWAGGFMVGFSGGYPEREKHVIEPRGPYDPAMYPLRHMKLAWPLKN